MRKIHYEWIKGLRSLCNYPISDKKYLTNIRIEVTCGNCKRILKGKKHTI